MKWLDNIHQFPLSMYCVTHDYMWLIIILICSVWPDCQGRGPLGWSVCTGIRVQKSASSTYQIKRPSASGSVLSSTPRQPTLAHILNRSTHGTRGQCPNLNPSRTQAAGGLRQGDGRRRPPATQPESSPASRRRTSVRRSGSRLLNLVVRRCILEFGNAKHPFQVILSPVLSLH